MTLILPLRARLLWGHAPRVRSLNRMRRTLATVSEGSKCNSLPLAILTQLTEIPDPTMS